ncbi:MAG: hypothetical protein QM753_15850 [Thermomicrobiales bacterium]
MRIVDRERWWERWTRVVMAIAVFGVLMGGIVPALQTAAAQGTAAATAEAETPSGSPVASPAAVASPVAGATPAVVLDTDGTVAIDPAKQALADKYAPVAMLKKQSAECDALGEPYLPISVYAVLDSPDVTLRKASTDGSDGDTVVKVGPSAQDLVNSDPTYYLDLPGDALQPDCDYEKWGRERVEALGLEPITYARVVTEADRPGELAVQYFFYWIFNDFVDNHESDWEMVQVIFDADTAEEALTKDPVKVAFAQHEGGETAKWGEDKLQIVNGTHIVIYPAAGSHADYYAAAIWIGWGERGSGFGCDRSDPEFVETPLKAVVIPDDIDPNGPFAWTLFKGRWGEKHPWVFNGPKSPNVSKRWTHPISWTDNLRDRSLPIPQQETLGTGPSTLFCTISDYAGQIMKIVPAYPEMVFGGFAAILIGLVLVSFLTWRYFKRAFWMYFRYIQIFLLSSILLIPVAALATLVQDLISRLSLTLGSAQVSVDATSAIGTGVGYILQLALVTLIAPSVILATSRLVRSEKASFFSSVRDTLPLIPKVALASIWNSLIAFLITITIIGIPFALYRATQWAYAPHAIVLDGAGVRNSRHMSRNAIKGDWLRTIGMASLVTYVAGLPGPIVGILLIIVFKVDIQVGGTVSSLIYAVMYPITIITSTLYYLHRKHQKAERVAMGLPGDSPGQGFWMRIRHPRTWRERIGSGPVVPMPPIPGPFPEKPKDGGTPIPGDVAPKPA